MTTTWGASRGSCFPSTVDAASQPESRPATSINGDRRGHTHGLCVPSCSLSRRSNEPSCAAVAGRVVSADEVVVDGLGDEKHGQIESGVLCRRADRQRRRRGVVAPDDEPVRDFTAFDEVNG